MQCRAFVRGLIPHHRLGVHHKNTNAKVDSERDNRFICVTRRALADARKDDWGRQLPLRGVLAIRSAASTLGYGLTPLFMALTRDCRSRPRNPTTGVDSGADPPAHYALRVREHELAVRELLAAAQQQRKEKVDAGRTDAVF